MKNFKMIIDNVKKINNFLENKNSFEHYLFVFTSIIIFITSVINIIRIFDNALWTDEMRTVIASRMPFENMIEFVISEGHSPLYYIFTWLIFSITGLPLDNYHIYYFHVTSIIPWFITIILSLTVVKKWFGNIASCVFSICLTLLFSSIYIALEVRMYSLCQLFVLLTFLIIYKCYQHSNVINFLMLSIFSSAAIYSHYFAFPTIAVLYFFITIYYSLYKKSNLWKPLFSMLITGLSLLPWTIVCMQSSRGG